MAENFPELMRNKSSDSERLKKKKLKQDEWKEIHTETQHGETAEY